LPDSPETRFLKILILTQEPVSDVCRSRRVCKPLLLRIFLKKKKPAPRINTGAILPAAPIFHLVGQHNCPLEAPVSFSRIRAILVFFNFLSFVDLLPASRPSRTAIETPPDAFPRTNPARTPLDLTKNRFFFKFSTRTKNRSPLQLPNGLNKMNAALTSFLISSLNRPSYNVRATISWNVD